MESLRDSLENIYEQYKNQLFTCAVPVTGCLDPAEDAVHKAFCKLLQFKNLPEIQGHIFSNLSQWKIRDISSFVDINITGILKLADKSRFSFTLGFVYLRCLKAIKSCFKYISSRIYRTSHNNYYVNKIIRIFS